MSEEGERFRRLGRVRRVHERKRQMAEWALAEAENEEARLERAEREILETLGAQSLMQGLFLEAKAAALRRVGVERRLAERASEAARAELVEIARTEKGLERAEREAGVGARAADEARGLAALLDGHLASQVSTK